MTRNRSKGAGLPQGFTRRHQVGCPAERSDDMAACECRPRFKVQAGPRSNRKTRTFATVAEGRSWKRDVERLAADGQLAARASAELPHGATFRDVAEEWLGGAQSGAIRNRSGGRYKPSVLRSYANRLAADVYPTLGDLPPQAITRGRLNRLAVELTARGAAPSSVRNAITPVRAVMRHLHDVEAIAVNPTVGVRVPTGDSGRMRVVAPEELGAYLDALDPRDRAVWATAAYAGLRRGELMGLQWQDVDLAAGVITVRRAYDPGSGELHNIKSAAGQDRRIPITAALRELLLEHRMRAGARPRGFVFARRSLGGRRVLDRDLDRPFASEALTNRARRAWHDAGLLPWTLHDGRHTFASLLIAAMAAAGRWDPKTVQHLMGHASIQITYDRYGHLFPGSAQAAGRVLGGYLSDIATPVAPGAIQDAVAALMRALADAGVPSEDVSAHAHRAVDEWLRAHGDVPGEGLLPEELADRAPNRAPADDYRA